MKATKRTFVDADYVRNNIFSEHIFYVKAHKIDVSKFVANKTISMKLSELKEVLDDPDSIFMEVIDEEISDIISSSNVDSCNSNTSEG